MKKSIITAALSLLICLSLAACANTGVQNSPTPSPTASPAVSPTPSRSITPSRTLPANTPAPRSTVPRTGTYDTMPGTRNTVPGTHDTTINPPATTNRGNRSMTPSYTPAPGTGDRTYRNNRTTPGYRSGADQYETDLDKYREDVYGYGGNGFDSVTRNRRTERPFGTARSAQSVR